MIIYKIETTVPSGRQYENLKTSYQTDNPEEIEQCKTRALNDLDTLYHCKRDEHKSTPVSWKDGDKFIQGNITWIVKDGKWTFKEHMAEE